MTYAADDATTGPMVSERTSCVVSNSGNVVTRQGEEMGFSNGKMLRVSMKATVGSWVEVNTFHYDLIDSPGQQANDPQSLADTFRDAVVPVFRHLYTNDWTIAPVEVVEEIDPLDIHKPRAAWVSGANAVGDKVVATDRMPNAACMLVQLKTDKLGRRYRGRLFVGGTWVEGEQAQGSWNAGAMLLTQNFVNAIPKQPDIATGPSASTANWVVYSRTQRTQNQNPYAVAIVSPVVESHVRWLRSRQEY